MEVRDDDLKKFEADGGEPLPVAGEQGYVEHDGASIWYATYGAGSPVVLLHGGLGHSGNWGYQIPALVTSGYRGLGFVQFFWDRNRMCAQDRLAETIVVDIRRHQKQQGEG